MSLAAVAIDESAAEALIDRVREVTGIQGEIKGSRIDLGERAFIFELFEKAGAKAVVSMALSATRPDAGADRGEHDMLVYAQLLNDAITALLPESGGCAQVVIDDGRYSPETLSHIHADISSLIGPCGSAALELSHRRAGLQIADVIANSFFTRALPGDRQARMAAIVRPMLESGRIKMRILPDN